MLSQARLTDLATDLMKVSGIVAVLLGGSRARGAEQPDSDVDLGLYYRSEIDPSALREPAGAFARAGSGSPMVTEPGAWGPWVDGGAWLTVDGVAVDWLYRDVDRVHGSWDMAQAGAVEFHFQVGHPLGVPNFAYAGEVALGVVLADPTGELSALKKKASAYPPALADALIGRLDEADFLLGALAKAAVRADTSFVAGSLFRVVGLLAHALHAKAAHWAINEKGLVDAAGRLPCAPVDFARRAHAALGRLGTSPDDLRGAVASVEALLAEVRAC